MAVTRGDPGTRYINPTKYAFVGDGAIQGIQGTYAAGCWYCACICVYVSACVCVTFVSMSGQVALLVRACVRACVHVCVCGCRQRPPTPVVFCACDMYDMAVHMCMSGPLICLCVCMHGYTCMHIVVLCVRAYLSVFKYLCVCMFMPAPVPVCNIHSGAFDCMT